MSRHSAISSATYVRRSRFGRTVWLGTTLQRPAAWEETQKGDLWLKNAVWRTTITRGNWASRYTLLDPPHRQSQIASWRHHSRALRHSSWTSNNNPALFPFPFICGLAFGCPHCQSALQSGAAAGDALSGWSIVGGGGR